MKPVCLSFNSHLLFYPPDTDTLAYTALSGLWTVYQEELRFPGTPVLFRCHFTVQTLLILPPPISLGKFVSVRLGMHEAAGTCLLGMNLAERPYLILSI